MYSTRSGMNVLRHAAGSDGGLGGSRSTDRLIPIGENLLRFDHLFLGTGEIEFQFSGVARDVNLDGFETVAFHTGLELFVGFVEAVFLKAIIHD